MVAVALLVGAGSLAAHLDPRPPAPGWRRAATGFAALALPVLVLLVASLDLDGRDTLYGPYGAADDGPGAAATTGVAALWALASAAGARRAYRLGRQPEVDPGETPRRRWTGAGSLVPHVVAAELGAALAAGRVLVEVDSAWGWLAAGLAALLANAVLAAALVRDGRGEPLAEGVLLLGAAAGAWVAVLAADTRADGVLATTLVAAGVVVLAYAALPGRLPWSYPGAVVVWLGGEVLVDAAGVAAVEASSLPLAALLAGIGAVQARRRARAGEPSPTMLVAGPALAVALGPTLAVAIDRGDEVRLALVTAVALAVLVVGLQRRWRAPVTAGAVVLVAVAASQGGPVVGQLPTVVVLATAGAALLAVGVAWERAVRAGRQANAWYFSLR